LTVQDTDTDDFWHNIGGRLLRFSDNFKKAVAQEPNPPETNPTTCFPEDQVTDEEVNDFLKHLIFAVNQPNEKRLSELISKELGNEFNLIDADLITSVFQRRIIDWMKEKQGSYQSGDTIHNVFSEMREKVSQLVLIGPTSEHTRKLLEYGVKFDDNVLPATLKEFLKSSNRKSIFNFITAPEQTLLGSTEINQMIEDIDDYKKQGSFISISLNTLLILKNEELTAFRKEGTNLLIVECKKEPTKEIQTLYKQLSEIIKCNSSKKVILIAPEKRPLAAQFKTEEHKERYQKIVDKITFRDLTSDSPEKLLDKKINFQGCKIALNQLMSADSPIIKCYPLLI
jgi:hypothetical protein